MFSSIHPRNLRIIQMYRTRFQKFTSSSNTRASCYANEMQTTEAFNSLYQWLANNRKYSKSLSSRPSYTHRLTFEDLKDLFFQAISPSTISTSIDADLQVDKSLSIPEHRIVQLGLFRNTIPFKQWSSQSCRMLSHCCSRQTLCQHCFDENWPTEKNSFLGCALVE